MSLRISDPTRFQSFRASRFLLFRHEPLDQALHSRFFDRLVKHGVGSQGHVDNSSWA